MQKKVHKSITSLLCLIQTRLQENDLSINERVEELKYAVIPAERSECRSLYV